MPRYSFFFAEKTRVIMKPIERIKMWPNKTVRNIDLALASVILGVMIYSFTKDYIKDRKIMNAYAVNHPESPS
jgi:hypothetical protein